MPHEHTYFEITLSGRGGAIGFRECKCGLKETAMYDFGSHKIAWVPGQFFDTAAIVFVFTANQFDVVSRQIFDEISVVCIDMNRSDAWEIMSMYRIPNIFLADDWKECPATDDYRFKSLVTAGHI